MVKKWSSMLLPAALMLLSCHAVILDVGSYEPADLNDERLYKAAVFAVEEMILYPDDIPAYSFSLLGNESSSKSSKNSKSNKSGKSSKSSSSSSDESISADDFRTDIMEAETQVVEGTNYRLTIQVSEPAGECIGAFEVVVYNHFGDLSVTTWGDEVACDDSTTNVCASV